MQKTLVLLLILAIAVAIYWPILRLARVDIAARAKAGLSNTPLFVVLLLPLVGPLVYLVFRGRFRV